MPSSTSHPKRAANRSPISLGSASPADDATAQRDVGPGRQVRRRRAWQRKRGHAEENGRLVPREPREHRGRRRALGHEDGRRTRGQWKGQRIAEPIGEEELRRREHDVALRHAQHAAPVQLARSSTGSRACGPCLWGARSSPTNRARTRSRRQPYRPGAASGTAESLQAAKSSAPARKRGGRTRDDDVAHLVRPACHRVLQHRQQRAGHDQRLRAAVRQHERIVVGRQQRVDGDRHDARMERAQERRRKVDRVVQAEQDALFAAQSTASAARPRPARRAPPARRTSGSRRRRCTRASRPARRCVPAHRRAKLNRAGGGGCCMR